MTGPVMAMIGSTGIGCHEKNMIGPIIAVIHWSNRVLLAGISKGPVMFSLAFGMAWCVNSHWANKNQPMMG